MLQLSTALQNARLDAMISNIETPATLEIITGSLPANCAAIDAGDILVTIALPDPFMLSASLGSISKTGTWEDASADMSGLAGHFRIYDLGGDCQMQGTVSLTGNGGDIILDSLNITILQSVVVSEFTIVDGNS